MALIGAGAGTISVTMPPSNTNVDVDFYDDSEMKSLRKSSRGEEFGKIPKTLSISSPALCAHYQFYKLRPGVPGYSRRRCCSFSVSLTVMPQDPVSRASRPPPSVVYFPLKFEI
jgi:hypothetical protein